MNRELDRRSFPGIAGRSLGFGALYQVAGSMLGEKRLGARIATAMAAENGEAPRLSLFTAV